MSETLIKVEGLYKKFTRNLRRGLVYGTKDTMLSMVGIDYKTDYLRKDEFWALQDINFELKRGEVLGLIGRNGCGKSTLLRLLTGIFPPDKGKITMKGRIGALIAVGAGFHPHMSGRENIYLNGTLLGMDRHEIKKRFEEIVEFSEIGEFIDAPVATYSSGMRVRLGFAIAAHIDPDILLIDEVLSVGDVGFRMKSLTKVSQLLKTTSVIFVSHNMPQVSMICSKAIVLKDGSIARTSEDVADVISYYFNLFEGSNKVETNNGQIEVLSFRIQAESYLEKEHLSYINFGDRVTFSLDLNVSNLASNYFVNYAFIDKDTKQVANLFSLINTEVFSNKGRTSISVTINTFSLSLGQYDISVAINEIKSNNTRGDIYYYNSVLKTINVIGVLASHAPVQFIGNWKIT